MLSQTKLFLMGKPVTESHAKLNKYCFMAYKYKFPHYRIINVGDLIKAKLKPDVDLPKYVFDFIGQNGEVLMIANIIEKHITSVNLRTLKGEKAFSVFGSQTKMFYGLGMINPNFKYNDWVTLVEGNMDCDTMRSIYPNVLGCMTAGLTTMQLEILKLLTRRVVLCYDNDRAGRSAYNRDSKKLRELGFQVKCLIQYEGFKDVGDLSETLYNGDDFTFKIAYKYYENKLNMIVRDDDW